jgi:hypothetical protein
VQVEEAETEKIVKTGMAVIRVYSQWLENVFQPEFQPEFQSSQCRSRLESWLEFIFQRLRIHSIAAKNLAGRYNPDSASVKLLEGWEIESMGLEKARMARTPRVVRISSSL